MDALNQLEDNDAEVSAAFSEHHSETDSVGAMKPGGMSTAPQMAYTIIDMDRSDDEESDHTPDPYTQHMRGRVSPSPYTANTERARQFNTYVRGLIEQKLDILIPISHQPRDLISEIITDASTSFPEFASCVRKRIRTYLKSYRRSKKVKDGQGQNGVRDDATSLMSLPHSQSSPEAALESQHTQQQTSSTAGTAVVTIMADTPQLNDDQPPEAKRLKLSPGVGGKAVVNPPLPPAMSSGQTLSNLEVTAVRQLITGYRESAAFLQRAADQLENMLAKDNAHTS